MKANVTKKAILVGVVVALAISIFARTSGSAGDPNVSVVDAYASESVSDASAVYITLHNTGGGDHLVGASSDAAATATLHGSDMTASGEIAVRAHKDTSLDPGGSHVMLEDLRRPLQPGDEVTVVLRFEHSAPMTLTVPVLSYDDVLSKVQK